MSLSGMNQRYNNAKGGKVDRVRLNIFRSVLARK